jgi:hypothetical protein
MKITIEMDAPYPNLSERNASWYICIARVFVEFAGPPGGLPVII